MRTAFILTTLAAFLTAGAVAQDEPRADGDKPAPIRILSAWRQMRRADVRSDEFRDAQKQIAALVGGLDESQKLLTATMLMDRHADDNINAAALKLFGQDFLTIEQVRGLLNDSGRAFAQRVLLRTYYGFCGPDFRDGVVSDQACPQLAALLAERQAALADAQPDYGEQRLMVHLLCSVLSRYGLDAGKSPEIRTLRDAMEAYADKAQKDQHLTMSVEGYLAAAAVESNPSPSWDEAVICLGHWDPLVQWKAAKQIAADLEKDPSRLAKLWPLLDDERDEVRRAVVQALGFAPKVEPETVVPKVTQMLLWDRGVTVQTAAAEALAARADQADASIDPLLEALATARPGTQRIDAILTALSHLAPRATDAQKDRMLTAAVDKLLRAPRGALLALKALGPRAAGAAEAVRAFRDQADRFERQLIDRHVLPAILPEKEDKDGEIPQGEKGSAEGNQEPGTGNKE
ncbi:MAG TPA: hypothetical protein DCX07_10720 [Phycisphaerales bacterium]|nr:hypothetical protein [Phycisphaerales bacterium]